jgi:hypothetical protein
MRQIINGRARSDVSPSYLVIWLFGYLVIWLFGYLVIWLFGLRKSILLEN